MIKKDLILAVVATFCITIALFRIIPTNSVPPYDPWADINDDGKLDMIDLWYEAKLFGALGDPTKNVTITAHANKLITLAENVTVPINSVWNSAWVYVDGYSKMTVCIQYTTFPGYFNEYWLYVGHSDGKESFRADYALNFGDYLVKTYDVMNEWIMIFIENSDNDYPGFIWVDVYLIP